MKNRILISLAVLSLCMIGCASPPKPTPREALFRMIDRMAELLQQKQYTKFVDECIHPDELPKALARQKMSKQEYIDFMDVETEDFILSKFMIKTFSDLRGKEPRFKNEMTEAIISGNYLWYLIEFKREGDTWYWCPP